MGLDFPGTGDYVNHGSDAAIDNLDQLTCACWFKTDATATFSHIYHKATAGGINFFRTHVGNSEFVFGRFASPTNTFYITSGTTVSTDTWYYAAAFLDHDNSPNPACGIYFGDMGTLAVEQSYTGGKTDGTGTKTSDASGNLRVGNDVSGNLPMQGIIAFFAFWDTKLTVPQIQMQQFNLQYPVAAANCKVFCNNYGFTGDTGTVANFSGAGSAFDGSPSGTVVGSHHPLGPIWGRSTQNPYAVAAPSGRIMSSMANYGGLAGPGGIAGQYGGLAG